MTSGNVEVLDCGIDYITCTATSPPESIVLREIGIEQVESEAQAGCPVKPWRGLGYAGKYAGSASYGVGVQGTIVRLSSGVARDNWRAVFPFAKNTTRLDLQVTLRDHRPASDWLSEQWAGVGKVQAKQKRPAAAKMICSQTQPETIMLGSRSSDRYGRIYDKGIESGLKELERAVRFELETKNAVAKSLVHYVAAQADVSACVVTLISRFILKRTQVFPIAVVSAEGAPCPRNAHKGVGALTWLRRCVSPVVSDYERRGQLSDVIEALGLSEVIQWSPISRREL